VPLVWQRRLGRGARRGGGELTDPSGAIRPAVEAALAVAREGLSADPISLPPHALRPYLDFARLSSNALRAIARTVERDHEFRARVAAAVDEQRVGRAGWLWLARPDGWEDELATIEAERGIQAAEARQERDERTATKRLAAAQAAAAAAEAEAAERSREALTLRSELAGERERRTDAVARLADAEAEVARLVAGRTEVIRKLKDVESRLVERSTELNAVKARLRELERRERDAPPADAFAEPPAPDEAGDARVDDGAGRVAEPASAGGTDTASADSGEAPVPASGPASADGAEGPTQGPALAAGAGDAPEPRPSGRAVVAGAQREELIRQVGRAAGGAADLADALAAVMSLLEGATVEATPSSRSAGAGEGPGTAAGPSAGEAAATADGALGSPGVLGAGGRVDGARGRVPIRLPGGIFDDSVEAAGYLLRVPGALLVVDGYNVSMTGWPELSVADQRRRLVAALAELAARTSTPTDVVFDGADVGPVPVPGPVRSLVHTQFSPPGVEADDVIIDLVAQLPPSRAVVVASSDNRVREGVRRQGANVVHAEQLVALLPRR
jgi:predicted RNA-binding protein with PIN domain